MGTDSVRAPSRPVTIGGSTRGASVAAPGWRARLALVAVGLIVAVLIVEAALRLLGPRVPGIAGLTTIATFQTYHPVYGFFHRPGAHAWIRALEFTSYLQINSRGLRDREIEPAKPPGTRRVLVLGDSFVEGGQVALEETIAKRLEAELQVTDGPPIEAINAGNAGFGTAQEMLFLDRDGRAYEPDVVALVFFVGNDLTDNSYAVSLEHGVDVSRRPFFVPDGQGDLKLLPIAAPPPDPLGGLKSGLRQVSLLYNVVENIVLSGERIDQENQQAGRNRSAYLVEPPPSWQEAWDVTEGLIGRTRDIARGMGAELVLVVAPSRSQVSDDAWRSLISTENRERARRYDPQAPNRRLAAIAERTGVGIVDLLPAMRAAHAAGQHPYFADDGHWTPAGHAVAARQVAEYLRSAGLVP